MIIIIKLATMSSLVIKLISLNIKPKKLIIVREAWNFCIYSGNLHPIPNAINYTDMLEKWRYNRFFTIYPKA